MHTCICVSVSVYVRIFMGLCVCVYAHTHTRVFTCVHVNTCINICVWVHVCGCVSLCVAQWVKSEELHNSVISFLSLSFQFSFLHTHAFIPGPCNSTETQSMHAVPHRPAKDSVALLCFKALYSPGQVRKKGTKLRKLLLLLATAAAARSNSPWIMMWIYNLAVSSVLLRTVLYLLINPVSTLFQYMSAELLQLRSHYLSAPTSVLHCFTDIARLPPRRRYTHRGAGQL